MKEERVELILSVLYISCAILSVSSLICMAIIWQYWTWVLDVCISIDCGCILYCNNTFSTFVGGDVKLCHFGVYGLIPVTVIGLFLGGYHGYRSCINRNLDAPTRIYDDRNLNINDPTAVTITIRSRRRTPYTQWMPTVFLTILLSCLSLSHAIIVTDGYYKTCEEYRKRLIQLLGSNGREAEVIYNRLSCGAIFDFMDYLQTDVADWNRIQPTDTGLALQIAIISTWFNFIFWVLSFILNYIMARKKICC